MSLGGETFLTAQEVIKRLQVSHTTFYRWLKKSDANPLPAPVVMYGQRRWREADLDAWMESCRKS